MKSDIELQKDVIDELRWDPIVQSQEIGVAVRDGVVTLTGAVDSFATKCAGERAALRVTGVRAVAGELEVRLPQHTMHSDTDLAHAVANALQWDVQVPDQRILARVVNGWVTLEGEVEWRFERDAAFKAVRNLGGVRGVSNMIRISAPKVAPFDVTEEIRGALRRIAELDADRITVEATGSRVTLRGTVHSRAQRDGAERAAWAAPGVSEVVDELAVIA